MAVYVVDYQPVGRRGECLDSESLLDCARRLGVGINTVCGGVGTCGSCKLRIMSGTVSEPTPGELETFSPQELLDGWRLACQTYPRSDCTLFVPPESMTAPQRTQVEGVEIAVSPEPPVLAYHVKLPAPSLSDLQADADRLLQALNQQHRLHCRRVDIDVLRIISPRLRSLGWDCRTSVRGDEVIAIGPWPGHHLGLAVDLGTTKIAGYLVDLDDGRTLSARGLMNPQISYGEDIISRITAAARSPEQRLQLQMAVVEALNGLVSDLCADAGASEEDVVEAVVVGNTAMHHLFLGLPVSQLAVSPFVPAVADALDIKAGDLGIHIAPGACVHLLPNIAGFVGADHVAMLLATEAWQAQDPLVALDIGTNTEVSLVKNGEITAVSCASGPAFEGGHIKDGMRAASGAIERLRILDDRIQYQTIDGAPPVGICGSGILDAVAQLYLNGIITESGRMRDKHPRVRIDDKYRQFVLVSEEERNGGSPVVVTQPDLRELQLAKSAIRTGIQVLLEVNGCSEEEISQVIIAGAFGSYIDVSSAIAIGMLPSLPLDRFRQVGNAAGIGAKLALVSLTRRAEARAVASKVHYVELASNPGFMQTFIQAQYLGQYRLARGQRVKID